MVQKVPLIVTRIAVVGRAEQCRRTGIQSRTRSFTAIRIGRTSHQHLTIGLVYSINNRNFHKSICHVIILCIKIVFFYEVQYVLKTLKIYNIYNILILYFRLNRKSKTDQNQYNNRSIISE